MNDKAHAKRFRAIGLVVLTAVLAALACTPSLDTTATTEPSGDVPPAGQEVPSPTATVDPTPTVEPPVVDGVFERAFYDPAADWGPPDRHDAFDGRNPLFLERSHANSAGWYGTDGRYHLTYSLRDKWVWYWSDVIARNFYADVIVINADHCVAGDSGGLIFRGHLGADAGYMFGVTCGGEYFTGGTIVPGSGGVVCWVGGGNAPDCDPGGAANSVVASEYIHAGPGAANRIGVMAEGSTYTFFINGRQVESFTDTSLPLTEGHFALYLGTGQVDTAEVSFDDFNLWDLH